MRWLDGNIICPRCNQAKHSFIKTRRIWYCNPCKKQFTVKVGTVMEDSPITLDKWMAAFWSVANCKNGISSHELARMLGKRLIYAELTDKTGPTSHHSAAGTGQA